MFNCYWDYVYSTDSSHANTELIVILSHLCVRNFVVVFSFCTAGFAIALHGLFPFMSDFFTPERTFLELFFALNGQFDSSPSIFEGDPNESVGALLFVVYIFFSGVILMNIVTATFAV